jgi:hypothetical protein
MQVKEKDLVVATHGRAFWILDDLTTLHQLTGEAMEAPVHLFKPRETYRINRPGRWNMPIQAGKNYDSASDTTVTYNAAPDATGRTARRYLDSGKNPPFGVTVTYHLNGSTTERVCLTFLNDDGQEIESFSGTGEAGLNRFVWDLRYPNAREAKVGAGLTAQENPGPKAPLAPPGSYRVRLTVGDRTFAESFEVLKDPRIEATIEDLTAQFDLHTQVLDALSETNAAVDRLRNVRLQVEGWVQRAADRPGGDAVAQAAQSLDQRLYAVESRLTRVIGPNSLNLPPKGLDLKLAALTSVVGAADFAPTRQSYEVFDDLKARVDAALSALRKVVDVDLAGFLSLVKELEVPLIAP